MPKVFQETTNLRPEDLVSGLLEACDIKEPPTDAQLIFDFLRLECEPLPTELAEKLSSTFKIDPNIRAILDLGKRLVLVHPGFRPRSERYIWASLHEVGHYVIPDHRNILYRCSWKDLSLLTQKRLEVDANRFAADLIFQNDLFIREASDSKLSIKVPIKLKDRYRTSFEATIRRYVEHNPRPCALVVYRPTQTGEFEPPLEVQYSVRSPSWDYFAYIIPRQECSPDSPEHKTFYQKEDDDEIVEAPFITGKDDQTTQLFPSELFSNTYRVFQFIHPPVD